MDSSDSDDRPRLVVLPALLDALATPDDRSMASLVMYVLEVQLTNVFRKRTEAAPRALADVRSDARHPSLDDDPAASLFEEIRMPVDDPKVLQALLTGVRPAGAEELARAFDAASPLRNRFQKTAVLNSLLLAAVVSMPAKAEGGIGSIFGSR